ncbi:MAG: DUF2357 domain-containing protein [Clostridia bacterium]|nr:DUF2357 domain-containing protein [Clostridia bacterium]
MADGPITRDVYRQYAKKITTMLNGDDFYEQFKARVLKGTSDFKLAKKRLIQDISLDWIATIEDVLPNLDTIVRNPRKFIVQEEDIVDVALAKSISTESIKFLAQHTNMISKVDKDGSVTPSKILNISKEESFEIYENRFIYTLLLKLKDFVTMRYDKIKKATATQDVLELDLESKYSLPSKKVTMRTEYFAQLSFDEVMRLDPETLTKVERVAKIDRIITDFLSSSFAKSMRNSAPVRPPIMRTNVILKEPNFKKALTLWQFVETYNVTAGFSTSDEVEDYEIEKDSKDRLRELVTLNTMIFESLYDQCESDMDMEDKEFADFLRVGEMDFEKDNLDRDEYAQKLEDEIENQDDEERVEEVKPQDSDEGETELPPPPPEEKEKEIEEVEKEVIVEVEKIIEVEKFKEMAPREVENELDLEPDADKFDQHLFEVRKLFKRPDDDKIKQEEIIKVKDAIDRCLNSYRKIKQDELDERDRQERIRRRKEDIEKRTAAFRKAKDDMAAGIKDDSTTFFGVDPFEAQKAKIEKRKEEEKKAIEKEKLTVNPDEKLDLDNPQIDEVNKEYEDNKKAEDKKAKKDAVIDKVLDFMNDKMPLENDEALRTNRQYTPPADEAPKETAAPVKEEIQTQPVDAAGERSGIKFTEAVPAHDAFKIEETKKPKKKKKNITPVDESKVQVGGINILAGNDDPFALKTGNFSKPVIRHEEEEVIPEPVPVQEEKPAEEPVIAEPAPAESAEPVKEEAPAEKPKKSKSRKKKEEVPEEAEGYKPHSELIVQEGVKDAKFSGGMGIAALDNPYDIGSGMKTVKGIKLHKPEENPENEGDN